MKKIYYLFAFAGMLAAFSSCKPLSKTYDTLGDVPGPVLPASPTSNSITLVDADYGSLPNTNAAQSAHFFVTTNDALTSIPTILNTKYPANVIDKSTVTVTFPVGPAVPSIKLIDSVYSHVIYTLTNADYLLLPKNTFLDFSDAQIITWFPYSGNPSNEVATSWGAPTGNTLAVPTFNYFITGTNTVQTFSYLYSGTAWKKIYMITAAQYASIGKGGTSVDFAAADAANLPAYFNAFLKADPAVSATAKVGDIQYVSYKYYGGSAANTFQRVMPMGFDGTNWVAGQKVLTAVFTYNKAANTWTGTTDNSVNYTLTAANYSTIAAISGIASSAAVTNLSHGNFAIAAGSAVTTPTDDGVRWTDAQIATGVQTILKTNYPSAANNQKFFATVAVYGGYSTEVLEYIYNTSTTTFVYQPVQSTSSYTITGDDITAIARASIGTAAASLNLNQYGDFSSAWTQANIDAGISTVLKSRYPAATANTLVAVSYPIYSGGNVVTTKSYKFDGTTWIGQ